LFFNCLISFCNINIHHTHICNDYLCPSNRLNIYYCHKFPMKHLLHLNKILCPFKPHMWHAYEDVFCDLFIYLCYLYGYHYDMLIFFTCFHIVISHSIICVIFVSIP
jgi:hypothetical protein